MRLVRVELARFFTRRAVAWLLLAAALLTAAVAAKTIWDSRPPSHGEVATAHAQTSEAAADPTLRRRLRECMQHPDRYLGEHAGDRSCRSALLPRATTMLPRQPLSVGDVLGSDAVRLAVIVAGVLVIAAATYAGGDWSSDSISTQLTFQSRRSRLWLGKATAATLAGAAATAVILGGFWLAIWLTALARDLTVPAAVWQDVGWFLLRAVALGAAVALGSYALTMLFRNTVATLAVLFAYAAGGEILVAVLPISGAGRWAAGNNLYAWLHQHFEYFDRGIACKPFTDCDPMRPLGQLDAAWFLGALLVVALACSVAAFSRSDA